MKIYWVSRHEPLPSQIERLRELAGEDVEIVQDPNPFSGAEDIVQRFEASGCDDLLVVAPITVVQRLVELGLRPLYAEMEAVPEDQAEVIASGRGYRFVGFKRIEDVRILMRTPKLGQPRGSDERWAYLATLATGRGTYMIDVVFDRDALNWTPVEVGAEVVDYARVPMDFAGMLLELQERGSLLGGMVDATDEEGATLAREAWERLKSDE